MTAFCSSWDAAWTPQPAAGSWTSAAGASGRWRQGVLEGQQVASERLDALNFSFRQIWLQHRRCHQLKMPLTSAAMINRLMAGARGLPQHLNLVHQPVIPLACRSTATAKTPAPTNTSSTFTISSRSSQRFQAGSEGALMATGNRWLPPFSGHRPPKAFLGFHLALLGRWIPSGALQQCHGQLRCGASASRLQGSSEAQKTVGPSRRR